MKLNLITQSHPAPRIRSDGIPESRVSSKCICCTFRYYPFFPILILIPSREGERESRACVPGQGGLYYSRVPEVVVSKYREVVQSSPVQSSSACPIQSSPILECQEVCLNASRRRKMSTNSRSCLALPRLCLALPSRVPSHHVPSTQSCSINEWWWWWCCWCCWWWWWWCANRYYR